MAVYAECVKPLPSDDLDHILQLTRPLWQGARGRRIFVTGGTGFFGAWLLESLAYCNRKLDLGLSATVLSRDPAAFLRRMPHLSAEPSLHLVPGDIRDFAFPDGTFDCFIHGAAPTTSDASARPADLLRTLIHGTERVLDFASRSGARKLLFLSSGAVYGRQPEGLSHISEGYIGGPDWLDPDAVYAEGKRISEQMCSLLARESEIDCTIARCFAFVGPHLPLNQHFAIGNFIADALAGRDIAIRGDGTPVRSYLYAADLAVWLWTLLFRGAETGSNPAVFNVGSGHAISIHDLAQEVVEVLAPDRKVTIAGETAIGAKRIQYVPDVYRSETVLGLRETINLREAIRRTAAWYR